MKKTIIIATVFVYMIIACSKSKDITTETDCSGTAKSFVTDVNPIIQSFCTTNSGCHASGSTNGPGALTTYQQIFNNRSAIRMAISNGRMPQNSTLSSSQKSAIICWIDNGASDN
jgi:hypothetical protein